MQCMLMTGNWISSGNSSAWVTHQPRSNMNNAVGLPRIEKMMDSGNKGRPWEMMAFQMPCGKSGKQLISAINWSIWTRGVWEQIKWPGWPSITTPGWCLSCIGQPIGSIKPGAQADLIIVDYQPFTELTADNLPWHIVFGFQESMIKTTLVAGKVLMRERKLLTLDEAGITSEALRISKEIWKSYQINAKRG